MGVPLSMAVKTDMEQAGMTKFLKLLGASGLAAVLGLVLFGAVAFAESPPSPGCVNRTVSKGGSRL